MFELGVGTTIESFYLLPLQSETKTAPIPSCNIICIYTRIMSMKRVYNFNVETKLDRYDLIIFI